MEHEMEQLQQKYAHVANKTMHYMKLAQDSLEQGDMEHGRMYLILLCTETSNYEESIAWNGLTPLWEQYRHLVEGLVPPSVKSMDAQPMCPEQCTMQIGDILALPADEILTELSAHLNEQSANGTAMHCLNKWERMAYYADELCSEINSGGFDGYLYYHGLHFEKAYQAFEAMGAPQMLQLMDVVRAKFPRQRIPKSEESLQNAMDAMEEQGIDFEAEDNIYYKTTEKELLEKTLTFVLKNKNHFR